VPEVTVQNIAERVDVPQAEAPMESAPAVVANNQRAEEQRSADAVVVDLNAPALARRESAAGAAPTPAAASTEVPTWRRDTKTWLAEIARLRNAGDTARADAELAEYKRQQRAYAGAPDR
jgi:hypothetical protein